LGRLVAQVRDGMRRRALFVMVMGQGLGASRAGLMQQKERLQECPM